MERRRLNREARRLSLRIDEVTASLSEKETSIARMEAMFADPDQFSDAEAISDTAEQYRLLKQEEQSCLEEWEMLSLEAESIEEQLVSLEETAVSV